MTEFVVRLPDPTPWDRGVFIAGDAEALGHWRPDGLALRPHGDGTWRATLQLPRGLRAKYLVTLGRWRTVESDIAEIERSPRDAIIHAANLFEVEVNAWGRNAMRYHQEMDSQFLTKTRPVTVWLPPGYEHSKDRRYPVFYLNDGQNLFDPESAFGGNPWRCDESTDRLIRTREIRPVILVGVGNTADRLREYGPKPHRRGVPDFARNYGRFLVEELKPFIDRTYRTLPGPRDTAIGGSSMGGLISLHLARWHPEVFGLCAALSPSLWWNNSAFPRTLKTRTAWLRSCRIWIDFGTREGATEAGMLAGLNRVRQVAAGLRELGLVDDRDFAVREIAGGMHTESAWALRFPEVLRFLFGIG